MFADFINDTSVGLIGVEHGGHGIETGEHGAPLKHGRVGIYFRDGADDANSGRASEESYSISPGSISHPLGRNMRTLNSIGRAVMCITDDEALEAKTLLPP